MGDILLFNSNVDTLTRLFEEVNFPKWGVQIAPEQIQRGYFTNYLG